MSLSPLSTLHPSPLLAQVILLSALLVEMSRKEKASQLGKLVADIRILSKESGQKGQRKHRKKKLKLLRAHKRRLRKTLRKVTQSKKRSRRAQKATR